MSMESHKIWLPLCSLCSRCIHAVAHVTVSFLIMAKPYSTVHCGSFIHSSVDGYLGSFHLLTVVSKAAMNIHVHSLVGGLIFSFRGGHLPRSGIAGSRCLCD